MKIHPQTADPNGVFRRRLSNGAVLLVKEDHASPVVSLNLWIEAGSIDERPGERGMAHLIEHMIFKGTEKRGVGEISREVEAAGGYLNAFTSFEHTCFYVVLPSGQIEKALEVEFDAYLHSAFDGEELKKEKEVVFEEMRMRQDDPWSWSWELLFRTLFRKNPYHWPVIGDMEILRKVPREKLLEYYRRHYVPSNTVLSVVGDISAPRVLEWVERAFAKVRRPPPPKRSFSRDPEQSRLRCHAEPGELKQTYLSLGFPTVPLTHPDAAALEILEAVLGDGGASRLHLAIREKSRSADETGSEHFTGKFGGAFVFQALTDRARTEKCLVDIMAEVRSIIEQGVPGQELEKVKNKVRASKVFEKQNMDGQAKTLGFWELYGDYRLESKFLKDLDSVTAQDIQRVARRYLQPRRASLILYHPKGDKFPARPGHWQDLLEGALSTAPEKGPPRGAGRKIQRLRLKDGSELWIKRRRGLPLVSLGVFFRGGFALEGSRPGITALMTKCLLKGTSKRGHEQFSREVESMASHLDPLMEKDHWGVTLDCLAPHLGSSLSLMSEMVYEPAFSKTEVEKEKRLQIAALGRLKDDPGEYALLRSDVLTFAGTPYGHMSMGTAQSLSRITPQDLREWHRSHLSPRNTIWVAVGDFDGDELRAMIEERLPSGTFPDRPKAPGAPSGQLRPSNLRLKMESRQAHLVLGFRAPAFGSREYFTFRILNTVLNGMGGRLFLEMREKRSLAYSVYAAHDAGLRTGAYQVYVGCAPSKVGESQRELVRLLEDLVRQGVSREELERAKTYMIGLYQVGLQSNRAQVHSYARYILAGLGPGTVDRFPGIIRSVTREGIQRIVRKYLDTDRKTWVILSPKKD